MLKSGAEHLQSLRDGRVIYIGSERVEGVTAHPAFRGAAQTVARLYDLKASAPELSYAEGGERYAMYYLRARSADGARWRNAQ